MLFKKKLLPTCMILIIVLSNGLFAEEARKDIKEPELAEKIKLDKIEEVDKIQPHYFTPIQFSFFSPLQAFPPYFRVYGLKLNVPYGNNKSVGGLDLGIVNRSENLYGIGCAALMSRREGDMCGINIAGITNLSKGRDNGFSFAGFYNEVETMNGIQVATLASRAKKLNGVQIGLLNTTHKMNGVQIGLLNYCKDQPFKYTLLFNFWDSGDDKKE